MNHQLQELAAWRTTGDPGRDDDPMDNNDVPGDPAGHLLEKAKNVAAGVPADLASDEPIGDDTLAKRGDAFWSEAPFGSAVGLRAKTARTEITNGWEHTYDANNELVSAREVNNDGGPLQKTVPAAETVEIRKLADGDFWRNTYQNGELIKMQLCYANGESETFDGSGERILEDEPLDDEDNEEVEVLET
jgi:hypothetical protein